MFEQRNRHAIANDAPPGTGRTFDRCATRSRKILQFKHYCTDAPI